MKIKIVVNADDFGMSSSVNQAIVWSMETGLVTSTTIMANMPGFEEACELARTGIAAGKVGVHINLVEGYPLTEAIRKCGRFCLEDGKFCGKLLRQALRLTTEENTAVDMEVDRQIQACLEADIRPTHLDSHHHYHTSWPIGGIVIRAAKRRNIPAVRLSGDCRSHQSWKRRGFVSLYNFRLRVAGLGKTDHFGALDDVRPCLGRLKGIVEIMVHPRYGRDHNVIDLEEGRDLKRLIESLGAQPFVPYPC